MTEEDGRQGGLLALIGELDSPRADDAEDAQAAVTALGVEVGPQLLAALPKLTPSGRICAIEVFEGWRYRDAAPALIGLLDDDDSTVLQWAASALGKLGHVDAVPELRALASRLRSEDVSPAWIEPVTVRWAMTVLGGRKAVVPSELARSVEHREHGDVWPGEGVEDLLQALAEHGQVILGFQVWRPHERFGLTWQAQPSVGWQFDRSAPWEVNVANSLEAALIEASALPEERQGLAVTIEWLDASDEA